MLALLAFNLKGKRRRRLTLEGTHGSRTSRPIAPSRALGRLVWTRGCFLLPLRAPYALAARLEEEPELAVRKRRFRSFP